MHPSRIVKSSSFKIYKDDTSTMSPSPQTEQSQPLFPTMNEGYDADYSVASTSEDEIIPPIESPSHEFSNAYTNVSSILPTLCSRKNGSRKHSAAYTSVSSIPPSLPYDSDIEPYTPKKGPRAAFRSPSSVRELQMGSPPPFASPRLGGSSRRYNRYESGMTSPSSSRRYIPETPSSLRSGSVIRQEYVESSQRSHGSDRGTPNVHKQQMSQRTGPIVLLHITLLPCSGPIYSAKSMKELAPDYIRENWRLLREKLTDTVLERGLLISHPGDEFDLLEERVLETLGLCPPRITACGHYYGGDSDSGSGNDSGVADVRGDSVQVRAICSALHEDVEEEERCHQCDQHMHLPGKGIGAGSRRWDVKIFAANGLMKASAWAVAVTCSDMERVDVEIEPWMPDDVKRALDARADEEEEEERRQANQVELLKLELLELEKSRYEAEAARLRAEECAKATEMMRLEVEAAKLRAEKLADENETLRIEAEATRLQVDQSAKDMDEKLQIIFAQPKATETSDLADTDEDFGPPLMSVSSLNAPGGTSTSPGPTSGPPQRPDLRGKDISLSTLLYNYMYLLAQDRRNLVLGFLSLLVLLLSYNLMVIQSKPISSHSDTHAPSAQILVSSLAPDSPEAVLDQYAAGKIESIISSTSVYSPSAPKASHIPRPEFKPEKEPEITMNIQTSGIAPHTEHLQAEQAFSKATSSSKPPWTEITELFVKQSCIAY